MGSRRKARECALQMLFAADVAGTRGDQLARHVWSELSDGDLEPGRRSSPQAGDGRAPRISMKSTRRSNRAPNTGAFRAWRWSIATAAITVYEFLHEPTPRTVIINEALEIDPPLFHLGSHSIHQWHP
jgi:N utilization substance protein B